MTDAKVSLAWYKLHSVIVIPTFFQALDRKTNTDKWFTFSLIYFIVFDRLAVKCRFVAWQRGLPRKLAGFVLS